MKKKRGEAEKQKTERGKTINKKSQSDENIIFIKINILR